MSGDGPLSVERGTGIGKTFPHALGVDGEGVATRSGTVWLTDDMADRIADQLDRARRCEAIEVEVERLREECRQLGRLVGVLGEEKDRLLAELERRPDLTGLHQAFMAPATDKEYSGRLVGAVADVLSANLDCVNFSSLGASGGGR